MFCLVATLLSADQNLLAPNLTAVAEDFGFTDAQRDKYLGGVISAAFFLLGAPAALLIGYLSDTMNRAKLLFWVVVLGMLANLQRCLLRGISLKATELTYIAACFIVCIPQLVVCLVAWSPCLVSYPASYAAPGNAAHTVSVYVTAQSIPQFTAIKGTANACLLCQVQSDIHVLALRVYHDPSLHSLTICGRSLVLLLHNAITCHQHSCDP